MDPQQILQFPHPGVPAAGTSVEIVPGLRWLRMPLPAFEAIPTLFQRELDTHQLFFAMGESMAHLHHLYYQGSLKRQTGAGGVIRYVQDAVFREGVAT